MSEKKVYIFCEDDVCEADECFEDLKKAHEEVFRLQKENEGLKKQNEKLSHDNKKGNYPLTTSKNGAILILDT